MFYDHVLHLKDVFTEHAEFYNRLKDEIPWHQVQWRKGPLPRLCCHSIQNYGVGLQISNWVTTFCQKNLGVNVKIRDIFGNYYRNGNDYLPQHSDNYSTDEAQIHVISLSFGVSRRFVFKKFGKVAESIVLDAGDIIMFDPYMNKNYTHGIDKRATLQEGRINLTCFVEFNKTPYGKKIENKVMSATELMAEDLQSYEYSS
jgi:hypothetical protein